MKPAKRHVMCVVLGILWIVAAGGRAVRRMPPPPQEPAAGAIRQRRQAFLEGVEDVEIHDERVEFEKAGQRRTQTLNQPPGLQWE